MHVGILMKDITSDENRADLTPGGVEVMRQNRHQGLVEKSTGRGA